MLTMHRCAVIFVIAVASATPLFAQATASAASASSSGSASTPKSNPDTASANKKGGNANQTKTLNFVRVYELPFVTFAFQPGSCFQDAKIKFPATNASDVAKFFGTQQGFSLQAISPNRVAFYYDPATKPALTKLQIDAAVVTFESDLNDLASSEFNEAVAIRVPSGSASTVVSAVTLPSDGTIVSDVVSDSCVVVLSKDQADPVQLAGIVAALSAQHWQQPSAPPTQRLFYVDATTVAKQLATSGDAAKDDSSKTSSAKATTSKPTSTSGDSKNGTPSSVPTISVNIASAGSPPSTDKAPNDDSTSSASTPDQPSNQNGTTNANGKKSPSTKPSGDTKTDSKSAAASKPPDMRALNDTLIFSNEDGSDRGILERDRLMAILDLPRPEVLMNIWSLEASSKDYKVVTAESEAARDLVANHNDLLQKAIDHGWASLSRQMRQPPYFNELFYSYVTQKFGETTTTIYPENSLIISQATPSVSIPRKTTGSPLPPEANGSPKVATQSQANKIPSIQSKVAPNVVSSPALVATNRESWGWCPENKYCLGFSNALEPLRPTFTNLLIGIVSADDPTHALREMLGEMNAIARTDSNCQPHTVDGSPCQDTKKVDRYLSCLSTTDIQLRTYQKQSDSCELEDEIALANQVLNGQEETLQLNCFKKQAEESFAPDTNDFATTRVGLLRAAIANFLFNYKWATQYPHDFIPYDLTQSAQELNAEFNPLVLSFNRDVSAFTENLQQELECKYKANIPNSDETFINDGILSVRGIGGVESVVDTVTQSFFDATTPPSLSDLAKSISDAEKNTPGVLKANLSADEAAVLLGAINSVQPATAKIGRELKLDVTPHSLPGASSAELEVKLTAQETANPTRFTADKSTEDTLSRIAKHDVSTRVRVESLKLFEISAFSATLQRPRSKFPIILPFVEVPYFGSFVGFPLKGADIYHRSTVIVSALIVPTATDLAFGIDFGADRICDAEECHRAKSPSDFGTLPLRNFHKAMVQCFASGGSRPYTGLLNRASLGTEESQCNHLSLEGPKEATPAQSVVPPSE
jgi:hypothetical protein